MKAHEVFLIATLTSGFLTIAHALIAEKAVSERDMAICAELSRQPLYQKQPFPLDCENL